MCFYRIKSQRKASHRPDWYLCSCGIAFPLKGSCYNHIQTAHAGVLNNFSIISFSDDIVVGAYSSTFNNRQKGTFAPRLIRIDEKRDEVPTLDANTKLWEYADTAIAIATANNDDDDEPIPGPSHRLMGISQAARGSDVEDLEGINATATAAAAVETTNVPGTPAPAEDEDDEVDYLSSSWAAESEKIKRYWKENLEYLRVSNANSGGNTSVAASTSTPAPAVAGTSSSSQTSEQGNPSQAESTSTSTSGRKTRKTKRYFESSTYVVPPLPTSGSSQSGQDASVNNQTASTSTTSDVPQEPKAKLARLCYVVPPISAFSGPSSSAAAAATAAPKMKLYKRVQEPIAGPSTKKSPRRATFGATLDQTALPLSLHLPKKSSNAKNIEPYLYKCDYCCSMRFTSETLLQHHYKVWHHYANKEDESKFRKCWLCNAHFGVRVGLAFCRSKNQICLGCRSKAKPSRK